MSTQALRLTLVATLMAACPLAAFGVGDDDPTPPTPTQTTETCDEGLIFDLDTETCMTPEESTNDDSAMMDAVRELAYAGRYGDARAVLDRLDPADTLVQTYYGFTARKLGDFDSAMSFYQTALVLDPDNILARSYMGQGLVSMGDLAGAQAQLSEIRARGGRQTWAETALRWAIDSGVASAY